jgi:L-iditol 2-dehydrogenase
MSRVKALQCSDIGKVELVEFPMPTVAEDALLIKVLTCGICGTDLHGIKGMRSQIKLPIIPGHEMIGEVHAIGDRALRGIKVFGDGDLAVGDRVTINPRIVCDKCFYCQRLPQRPEMCMNARTYNSSIRSEAPPHLFGGWAEYIYILPGSEIVKVPSRLSPEIGILAEPLACAVGAIDRYRRAHDWIDGDAFGVDQPVVVYGCGAIGMGFVAGFGLINAKTIIAVDVLGEKLALATQFGATHTINVSEQDTATRVAMIKDLTDGLGAGVIVEACGVPAVLTECVEIARRGAKVFELGHLVDAGPATVDPLKICRNEIEILGNYAYPSSQCMAYAARLLAEHALPYEKLVGLFRLDEHEAVLFGDRATSVIKAGFQMV